MNEIAKVAIRIGIVALKVASTYLIAKSLVEAGDKRWGKNPQ
jgi:hypothetical protein